MAPSTREEEAYLALGRAWNLTYGLIVNEAFEF
jgi:hypothetical protein